jgi:hypothetical protein
MRQHSIAPGASSAAFVQSFHQLIGLARLEELWKEHGPRPRGHEPKLNGANLICSLVFHVVSGAGTLGEHVKQLFGMEISDSALSQRRAAAGLDVFAQVVQAALRPLAKPSEHHGAFYEGLRLVGMDGCQFSVSNTPQILGQLTKALSRRLGAAFAKLPTSMLVELGTHHPLAVEVGINQESEWALSRRILGKLQADWLVLADRLYGVGAFVNELLVATQSVGSHFLVRVRQKMTAKITRVLIDGSTLVRIPMFDARNSRRGTVEVREINGRVRRPNGTWVSVRLWTSLLDPIVHPAAQLLALYARRWEIELFNRELKIDLRNSPLLNSHTIESAGQEILALVLAMAVLSRQRLEAAQVGGLEPLRISFGKTLVMVRSLWWMLAAGEGLLAPRQVQSLVDRTLLMIAAQCLPKRRARSCPRAVRQPVKGWPRLNKNVYQNGPTEYELLPTLAV